METKIMNANAYQAVMNQKRIEQQKKQVAESKQLFLEKEDAEAFCDELFKKEMGYFEPTKQDDGYAVNRISLLTRDGQSIE